MTTAGDDMLRSDSLLQGTRSETLKMPGQQLLTPVRAMVECSESLLSEVAESDDDELRDDVAKLHDAAHELLSLTVELFHEASAAASDHSTSDLNALHSRIRHDVGNVLNQILGYSEMLLEDAADRISTVVTADLKWLHASGKQMAVLIDRLGKKKTSGSDADLPAVASGPDVKLAPSETGKILVVEDNAANRELLARRLTSEGHTVVTAEDGRVGLRELAAQDFDLVLLDIVMPQVNGLQVLERLKADERLRDIPVIMISALDEVASAVRCIAIGAEDYLSKPFDPVLLRARIGACLEKKRLRDREKMHLSQIEAERRRSDELLHVILPNEIVEELRTTNRVEPRRHESVAVMFADIVGFTHYCDTHAPEDVVHDLQRLVESWEEIALRCEVQKIKTIGDAFMAAAGLLKPLQNPVLNCARCALEMIEVGGQLTPHWPIRVGIHLGPVVAGVLGRRQYLYDLWGDTVNTAARIQSRAAAGSVALSEDSWRALADLAQGESLGTVELKGKGRIEITRLLSIKTDL